MAYTTATLVEAELRLTTSFSASTVPSLTQVTTWIDEESAQIDSDNGKSFTSTSYSDTINYDGTDQIFLKVAPVISVERVVYTTADLGTSSYALDNTAVEDIDYTRFDERGIIEVLPSWSGLREGLKTARVDYTAGYATTPLEVQKLATKMVAKRVIDTTVENDLEQKSSGKSVSVGSINIVKSASFGVGNYKQLNEEIKELKEGLTKNTGVHRYTNY